ncbi:MAG: DoxX family protein [Candidatus Magasanikbacteria bacterium]|nr:DoxX family protein [Candidatus Magasanikbacteria bacterium]
MSKSQKIALFILRVVLGWMYFYAGITKLADPGWSAAFYIKDAHMFTGFYQWLMTPNILPIVNFLNEWGLTLLGMALIFGVFVRLGSLLGIALMILYYLPILKFPYPNAHAFIVDEHIIYSAALAVLVVFKAGRAYGLEKQCAKLPICSKFPKLRNWLG